MSSKGEDIVVPGSWQEFAPEGGIMGVSRFQLEPCREGHYQGGRVSTLDGLVPAQTFLFARKQMGEHLKMM